MCAYVLGACPRRVQNVVIKEVVQRSQKSDGHFYLGTFELVNAHYKQTHLLMYWLKKMLLQKMYLLLVLASKALLFVIFKLIFECTILLNMLLIS